MGYMGISIFILFIGFSQSFRYKTGILANVILSRTENSFKNQQRVTAVSECQNGCYVTNVNNNNDGDKEQVCEAMNTIQYPFRYEDFHKRK